MYNISKTLILKIKKVQNSAASQVAMTRKYDHITTIVIDLHLLPVKYRIELKVLLFSYKAINNLAPKYTSEFIEEYKPQRQLRCASQFQLK